MMIMIHGTTQNWSIISTQGLLLCTLLITYPALCSLRKMSKETAVGTATKAAPQEGGKQAAKGVTEAAMKVGEAAIEHTITAKRAAIIYIINESDLTLDHPRWEMRRGHAASEGLPPEVITKSSSQQGVDMTFIKPRVSLYGCEGVLVYRYIACASEDQNCFLAIKFSVPGTGENECTLALLSKKDMRDSERVRVYDGVAPKLYKFLRKDYFKEKPDDIDRIRSKSCKWMELHDTTKKVVFGCTMSGEDHAVIRVKISEQA